MCKQSLVREAQFYGIESEPLARLRKEFESKQVAGKHEWITFNVRGQKIQTYRSTILNFNYSNGMTTLADMINDTHPMCRKDVDGCYLLDRNPTAFQYVLEYLKRKLLYWPEALDSTYMYYECLDYGISDNAIKTLSPKQGQDLYGSNPFRRSRLGQWEDDNSVSDVVSYQNPSYNNRRWGRSSDAVMDMNRTRNMFDSSRQFGSSAGYDSYDRNMLVDSSRRMGPFSYDMYDRNMQYDSSRRMGPANANSDVQDRNLAYQNATNPRSNYAGRIGEEEAFNDSSINVDRPQGILHVPMRQHRRHSDALLDMNRGRSDMQNMNLSYQRANINPASKFDSSNFRQEDNFNEAMDTSNDGVRIRVPRVRNHRRHSTTDLLDMNRNRRTMDSHRHGSSWNPDVQDLNLAYQKAGLLEGNFRLDDNGKNTDFSFSKSDY